MFALARRMGYEMRPIARHFDAPRQTPSPRSSPNKDYRAPFRPRDYSRTKCFSCGQLGHTQVRCPKPDSSLPFRPSGWVDRSDGPQRNSGGPTGKRNIGRDLTHTGLYVIDSDRASSFSVIPSTHPDNSIIPTSGGVSSSDLATGQLLQPLTRVADIQINATGGDVTEQTSIQIRRGSTATDSPPVEDDVEQFSAHEREELTETGIRLACSSGVCVDCLLLRLLVNTTPEPLSIIHHHTTPLCLIFTFSFLFSVISCTQHMGILGRQPFGYEMSTLRIHNI